MKKFMKYNDAKEEMNRIKNYIYLVENYKVDNVFNWIVKQYALTNSIAGVVRSARNEEDHKIFEVVDREKVLSVLNSPAKDELHKIIIQGYKAKIRRKKP
ncbi:hypothetical protein [Jeotgalicoccus psychrophilus]|uniref:hypothetical protein n=1 Tax=Jeotgalicoccus psychrophilus TaxID=157228 RepID=UPI0004097193|nr:hypothetical protein [Jeotgalicoccus psychrophilus]